MDGWMDGWIPVVFANTSDTAAPGVEVRFAGFELGVTCHSTTDIAHIIPCYAIRKKTTTL